MNSLCRSFDPDEIDTPRRGRMTEADRVEAGALAIYSHITRTEDRDKLAQKWADRAMPRTRDDCRAMAAKCLAAGGR